MDGRDDAREEARRRVRRELSDLAGVLAARSDRVGDRALLERARWRSARPDHPDIVRSRYLAIRYTERLVEAGAVTSVGSRGDSFDAVAESFFATLKVELVDRHHYRTRAEARASMFRWIAWYNQRRLHSTNNYLPPLEWEHQHRHDHPLPSPLAA